MRNDAGHAQEAQTRRLPLDVSHSGESRSPSAEASALPAHASGPLDQVIQLLQGCPEHVIADPGITLLSPAQLDSLQAQARAGAEHSRENAELLLHLFQCALGSGYTPGRDLLLGLARRLTSLLHEQQRWSVLADNAAYYREHPPVAGRIASSLRKRLREGRAPP